MLLTNSYPFFIGFEETFRRLEEAQSSVSKQLTGYPPYNISKLDDSRYLIELAVAGFGKKDIEIELADNILKVRGKYETLDKVLEDGTEKTFIHKGIADRVFTRQFTLADNVEIKNAKLINGMLKIYLEHVIPENKKPKKIKIDDDVTKPPEFLAEDLKV
jgi:molecular chaperone IbpA